MNILLVFRKVYDILNCLIDDWLQDILFRTMFHYLRISKKLK